MSVSQAKFVSHEALDERCADGGRIEGGGVGVQRHDLGVRGESFPGCLPRPRESENVAPLQLELPARAHAGK